MRLDTLAIVWGLAFCTSMPTFAAPKKASFRAPTYASCEALAMERGVLPQERRSTESPSAYRQFMVACLAGEISTSSPTPTSEPKSRTGQRLSRTWDSCATLAEKRGDLVQERHEEQDPSPWGQFMNACMNGRIR
jgi:hypothetical protein